MRYRKLSPSGDMTFGKQQANFHTNSPEAVGQAVMTTLKLWRGEWFLDQSVGVPYTAEVLGKGTRASLEPALRTAILNVPDVQAIEAFDVAIDPDRRAVSIKTTIETLYGTAQIAGVL